MVMVGSSVGAIIIFLVSVLFISMGSGDGVGGGDGDKLIATHIYLYGLSISFPVPYSILSILSRPQNLSVDHEISFFYKIYGRFPFTSSQVRNACWKIYIYIYIFGDLRHTDTTLDWECTITEVKVALFFSPVFSTTLFE